MFSYIVISYCKSSMRSVLKKKLTNENLGVCLSFHVQPGLSILVRCLDHCYTVTKEKSHNLTIQYSKLVFLILSIITFSVNFKTGILSSKVVIE